MATEAEKMFLDTVCDAVKDRGLSWPRAAELIVEAWGMKYPADAARVMAVIKGQPQGPKPLPAVSAGSSEPAGPPLVFLDGTGHDVYAVRALAYSLLLHAAHAEMAAGAAEFFGRGKDKEMAARLTKTFFPHLDKYRAKLLDEYAARFKKKDAA